MPALFSHPPFVALGHDAPPSLLRSIARIAPLLVEADGVAALPKSAEYWARLPAEATYEEAVPLLDGGAQRIVSPSRALLSQVPPNRLILELAPGSPVPDATVLRQVSGVLVTADYGDLAALQKVREQLGGKGSIDQLGLFVLPTDSIDTAFAAGLLKAGLGAVPTLPLSYLSCSTDGETANGTLDIGYLFTASLTTDRDDGLFSTVVHSPSGECLGLVYSSPLSLAHSIASTDDKPTYFSRSRNALWLKGATSGAYQRLVAIRRDCDGDALEFLVDPVARIGPQSHFCHTGRSASCFGPASGLDRLETTLLERKASAPEGSYSARLFGDRSLLDAKIREEADEVCRAKGKEEVASEAADLLYFLLARCAAEGVSLDDVAAVLDRRADKVTRRPGNAKPAFVQVNGHAGPTAPPANARVNGAAPALDKVNPPASTSARPPSTTSDAPIVPPLYELAGLGAKERAALLKRPLVGSDEMLGRVRPIIDAVRTQGDAALRSYVAKLDRCAPAASDPSWPIVLSAPFDPSLMQLDPATRAAIDQAFANIAAFHQAQMDRESKPLAVETMPGITCKRMARPIDRVGLYIPGGTAVLPSTALMLAIPASIARCPFISIATPAGQDGAVRPEIVYIAHRCGVKQIVRAGGAHAVAAMAYGTSSVGKVDKVFGPGNQWVTAAKMSVSMDSSAGVGIDMPAGPSEVLVIADHSADPAFVASDLLSQAEHGPDSQVVLLAIDLTPELLGAIQKEIDAQARALPRVDVVRTCLTKSLLIKVETRKEAIEFSNAYAPEHLILHLDDAEAALPEIRNAGSVFVGAWSPESCGDYASGTNHTLPTYGYARQYSGVSTSSFLKHITTQALTPEGLDALGPTVVRLAEVEGLEAHANAVRIRLERRKGTKA